MRIIFFSDWNPLVNLVWKVFWGPHIVLHHIQSTNGNLWSFCPDSVLALGVGLFTWAIILRFCNNRQKSAHWQYGGIVLRNYIVQWVKNEKKILQNRVVWNQDEARQGINFLNVNFIYIYTITATSILLNIFENLTYYFADGQGPR